MKKLSLLAVSFGLLLFVSCNDDAADLANEIVIDEYTAPLANGYFIDIGSSQQEVIGRFLNGRTNEIITSDHYTQIFFITDGELVDNQGLSCVDCNWEVWVYAISAGPESFDPDDYSVQDWFDEPSSLNTSTSYAWIDVSFYDGEEPRRELGISELYFTSKSGALRIGGGSNDRWSFRFNDLVMYDYYGSSVRASEIPSETVSASGRFSGTFTDITEQGF